ncbi:MAG: hypothetical protein RMK29_00780 [Myxococcales bacterium]|nr:hypothetical protein [Myxococcota bacterium]MDW8280212.1 hypothetical protein [Myxococcales bacterium]
MKLPVPACLLGLLSMAVSPACAAAGDFWSHWGDGRAELAGYRLRQPRYGHLRDGTAVLIFVTEDMSDSLRVKADPGRHPPTDVYPVLKLNWTRTFQTGIYPYHVMTSVFSRVDAPAGARPWPVRKISFSSQEWCGHVYHQLLPRGGKLISQSHSYFDGEADAEHELPAPPDGVSEDELPILLRSYPGRTDYLSPGRSVTVPFLPALLRVRLSHQPLRWTRATLTRAVVPEEIAVPAGRLPAFRYTISVEGGPSGTLHVEAVAPHRILSWRWSDGEEGTLLGATRLKYWELSGPGQERFLRQLGLHPPRPAADSSGK